MFVFGRPCFKQNAFSGSFRFLSSKKTQIRRKGKMATQGRTWTVMANQRIMINAVTKPAKNEKPGNSGLKK